MKIMGTHCHIKCNLEAWFISKVKWYPQKCWICHHVLVGWDQAGHCLITWGSVLNRASKLTFLPQPFFFFFLKGEREGKDKLQGSGLNTVYALAHFNHPKMPEAGTIISPILRMRRVWFRKVKQPAPVTHKQGDIQVATDPAFKLRLGSSSKLSLQI